MNTNIITNTGIYRDNRLSVRFTGSRDKYFKVRNSYNEQEVANIIKRRAKSLPDLMSIMVESPVNYTEGKIGTKEFSDRYLDLSVPFYKRINVGKNHEEYCNSYNPEITMIKKIVEQCNDYINNNQQVRTFNSSIETAMENYSKTPIKRDKVFIA